MKNGSNKNDEDIQDDYAEDEDDYFKGVNKNIMNWDDYRNVDGASVMELIALNARHKTNVYPTHNDQHPYRK
ncbi:unnamed protein product [Xylocopa violacea]|uniref:Uncharacterized protein n=1 Tax=Xylocopa violacea TaxID=135666 RepID=A0ABP1NS05_XYLVO